jgi:hypothetical protein
MNKFLITFFLGVFNFINADLTEWISKYTYVHEGTSDSNQRENFFLFLNKHLEIRSIAETGFNAGHSAEAFLKARSDTTVISFDEGKHECVLPCQEYFNASCI